MRLSARLIMGGLLAALPAVPTVAPTVSAQPPSTGLPNPNPVVPVPNDDVEVLTRGPVHEAFASTAESATAGTVIDRLPPKPIEELPPDQKPDGDNVQWIPGYWHYDEERTDFIWISGFWRVPPPGRVWMPGSWREVRGGRQWVNGFWQPIVQQQQQLEYLPTPPQPLEIAPSVPQPSESSLYVPGCWVWRERYVWRPGFWMDHRPGWVWCPSHYRYTPGGYLYVDGYWDYPVAERGILFSPVAFAPVILNQPAFVYTPVYAVPTQAMFGALFVRRGFSHYYYGDYFEQRYTSVGFSAWCGHPRGTNFAINISIGRGVHYDPLWSYYQTSFRNDPVFVAGITDVYVGRYNGVIARPPRTLIQQNNVVNNITNVTNVTNITNNNTTIVNNNSNNRSVTPAPVPPQVTQNLILATPLKTLPKTNTQVALREVSKEDRVREQQYSKQLTEVASQRTKAENQLADRQLAPKAQTDKPRQVTLEVPKQVVARGQAPVETKKPLPPPPTQTQQQPTLTAQPQKPGVPPQTNTQPKVPVQQPTLTQKPSTTTTPEPTKKPLPIPGAKQPQTLPPPQQLPPATKPTQPPMPNPPKIGAPPVQQPAPVKQQPAVPVMPPKPSPPPVVKSQPAVPVLPPAPVRAPNPPPQQPRSLPPQQKPPPQTPVRVPSPPPQAPKQLPPQTGKPAPVPTKPTPPPAKPAAPPTKKSPE